ncbi:hypothetical protein MTO96_044440, partial [Rhipicephalus appendiculatus]
MLELSGIQRSSIAAGERPNADHEVTGPTNDWQKIAPHNKTLQPIGEDVSLHAYVLYDPAYNGMKAKETVETESTLDVKTDDPVKSYFVGLFREVERYFHNHSIMINVTVKDVIPKNFTSIHENKFIDAKGTLRNLT